MTDSKTTGINASALQVFKVLDVLMRHFAHGLTPGDLIKATGISGPNITRYVATLEAAGYAERIPETGRIRPSVRMVVWRSGVGGCTRCNRDQPVPVPHAIKHQSKSEPDHLELDFQ